MYIKYNDAEIKDFENSFNSLIGLAKEKSTAKHIIGHYTAGICPYLQYIKFDALEPEDYPNHLPDNSIFITFRVDYQAKKVELRYGGHIYLSPKDRQSDKFKYYAMRGMINIAKEDYGVNKFRKQNFKNTEDLFNRMEKYYKDVMEAVKKYTGGYPYKEGIIKPNE